MSKYRVLQQEIFSTFGADEWKAHNIPTYPSELVPTKPGTEYIRISVVPGRSGVTRRSLIGVLMIDIFVQKEQGPKRISEIGDLLDSHLSNKYLELIDSDSLQLMDSGMTATKLDRDNPSLAVASYSVPFKYFGV